MDDIVKAPLWQKILAVGLVLLVVLWGYNKYLYAPKVKEINYLKNTLKSIDMEIELIVPKESVVKDGIDIREAVKKELAELMKKIPTESEIPFIIDELISRVGSGLSITYKLIQPQPRVSEGKYLRLPLKLNFFSDYTDLNLYLKQLKKLPATVRIDSISLTRNPTPPKLSIDMSLSAFVMPGSAVERTEIPLEGEKKSYLYDPFYRPSGADTGGKDRKPAFILQGIWKGKAASAIINNKEVKAGDTIDGYKVILISKSEVTISGNGETLILKFEGRN